jgi:hypothetical protein
VYDAPNFANPVNVELGEVVVREGFVFRDLIALDPSIRPRR